MRIICAIVTFIVTFMAYHIGFGCNVFPVDENNVLQAPAWYPLIGIALSAFAAYFVVRKRPKTHKTLSGVPFVTVGTSPWIKSFGLSANRVVQGKHKGQGILRLGKMVYITLPAFKFIVLDRSTIQQFSILCRKPNTSLIFIRSGKYQVEVFYRNGGSSVLEVTYKLCEALIRTLPDILTTEEQAKICPVTHEHLEKARTPMPSIKPTSNTGKIPFPKIDDPMFSAALECVFDSGVPSVSMIQRRLKLGYGRAARLIDQMEGYGIVGPFYGSKPREILVTPEQCIEMLSHINQTEEKPKEEASVDVKQAIMDEDAWRKDQTGLSDVEYELRKVDGMEGHQFEYWCADLLRKVGFVNVEVTQGSNDQGVDILAEKDGIRYAIQCKCYFADLGNKPIQEVNAGKAIYHCIVGAVLTNSRFTQGGKDAAEANGILLWDRDWIKARLEETGM